MASSTQIKFERENESERVSNFLSNVNKDNSVTLHEGIAYRSNEQFAKDNLRKRTLAIAAEKNKKKKVFVKRFRKEWMEEPIFRGWLYPILSNNERCWCAVCNVVLLCGHSELEKHASGKKHSDLMEQLKNGLLTVTQDPNENILSFKQEPGPAVHDDALDFQEETLEVPEDGTSVDTHVVFHLNPDGSLVEMPAEDYEKLTSMNEDDKIVSLHKETNVTKTNTRTNNAQVRVIPNRARVVNTQSQIQQINKLTTTTTSGQDHLLMTDTDEDFDDDEDDDDDLVDSAQLIKEMKAEVLYQEKKMAADKRAKSEKLDFTNDNKLGNTQEELMRNIAERELEVRLQHLEERRRQRFNIYKLKLQEMDARVRLAEGEVNRSEELHKLKLRQIQLELEKQEDSGH